LLTDEAYAVAILRYREGERETAHRHFYFLGTALALWSTWQLSTAVGVFFGAQVPESWGLDFTLAMTFIAIVVPALADRPSLLAALTAGIVAVSGYAWPYQLGLMAAALVGIVTGLLAERLSPAAVEERR